MTNAVIAYLIACVAIGAVGRNRRIGWLGFFLASVLLTPLVTLVILILTAPKEELRHRRVR